MKPPSPHRNTQNANNVANPLSAPSVVEPAPPNIGSSLDGKLTNGKSDMDISQSKTATTLQLSPEEFEKRIDFERSLHAVLPGINRTNDFMAKKFELNKYDSEVTTQKVQPKAAKIVDNYPIGEPHEPSNSIAEQPDIGAYSDVYTNFIDVGQQPPRNNGSMYSFEIQFDFVSWK